MDESGVEPETFRMLSERATNYATRPFVYNVNLASDPAANIETSDPGYINPDFFPVLCMLV